MLIAFYEYVTYNLHYFTDHKLAHLRGTYWKYYRVNALSNTVRCRYNTVNIHQNHHNRCPIARPSGRGMGCILWLLNLKQVLFYVRLCCVQNHIIFDRFITVPSNWHLRVQSKLFQLIKFQWSFKKWDEIYFLITPDPSTTVAYR